jgi:hypothetical protein
MTTGTKPNFHERTASRQSSECPVIYTDGFFCASGVVQNFTAVGIRVRGTQPVKAAMKLIVFFLAPDDTGTLLIRKGVVRWIDGSNFGIDLSEVSPESQTELRRLAGIHLRSLWAGRN